jgi:hypothetical protein
MGSRSLTLSMEGGPNVISDIKRTCRIFGFLNGLNLLGNRYLGNGVLWRFVVLVLSMYFGKNIKNR